MSACPPNSEVGLMQRKIGRLCSIALSATASAQLVQIWRTALFDRYCHRLALIDDMDGKKLQRLVVGNFESAVRHITNVDFGCARFQANLLAIGQQQGGAIDYKIGFLARMGVKYSGRSRRYFNSPDNNLHICAGQITLR